MWLDRGHGERVGFVIGGLALAIAVGAGLVAFRAQRRVINLDDELLDGVFDDEAIDEVEEASLESFPASDAPARRSIT